MMPAKLDHSQGNMEILQAAADTFLWIACWLVPAISSGPVDNTGISCVKRVEIMDCRELGPVSEVCIFTYSTCVLALTGHSDIKTVVANQ